MKKECLVTIITPVYNGEKYLDRYIENIQRLAYEKLQVIVVNDGSTDGSAKKLKAISDQANRFVFLNKIVNEGVSCVRNDALDVAEGKYIFMFDCDDTFEPSIAGDCISCAKNDSDTVCYNYASVRKNGSLGGMSFLIKLGLFQETCV